MKIRLLWFVSMVAVLPSCDQVKQTLAELLGGGPAARKFAAPSAPAAAPSANPSGGPVVVDESTYPTFITQTGRLVMVDFYADWCGPCRSLGPVLERIANEHRDQIVLGKVNVDRSRQLAANAGVTGIPDVRMFINGKEVDRFVGAPPADQVNSRIQKQLAKLKSSGAPKAPAAQNAAEKPAEPKPKPLVEPMSKDWLPKGMEKR